MQKVIYIVIIVFISKFSFAQSNGYTTANASVNLIMPLSIEAGSGDLDFGEIILTGSELSEKLNPKNGQEFLTEITLN